MSEPEHSEPRPMTHEGFRDRECESELTSHGYTACRCAERLAAPTIENAAEMFWVVLANVSGGDWTKQSEEWQGYAARWRDYYFAAMKAASAPNPASAPDPRKELRGTGARLRSRIVGGELVIAIGIDVLAHAFLHSPGAARLGADKDGEIGPGRLKVTDPVAFARDVRMAMAHEREDGSSPLTDFIDQACADAVDDGCRGIWVQGDDEA